MNEAWEKTIGAGLGRECPRVDLLPELAPVSEMLEFAVNERLRPALGLRAEVVAEVYSMTSEDLNEALSLVSTAMCDPAVLRILNPKVEA